MSYIWTFSPESKSMLERCLSATAPPDESNKWLQRFGPRNMNLIDKTADILFVNDSSEISEVSENQYEELSQAVEEFLDPDLDLLSKMGDLVEKCKTTPKLLEKLAQTLPKNTAEKLLTHFLNTDDLEDGFLELFYQHFLHSYMKKDNSRFCTDVLLSLHKKYPKYLKLALKVILKDVDIETNIVNDFISNLNNIEQAEFLNILSHIEFTAQEFSHNLFNIYTAYKSCNKTDTIQNYILLCLKNYGNFCCLDKNYGKLLLKFLEHENSLHRDVVSGTLEEIIEIHKSPFRRPCLSVLKSIKDCK